MCFYVYTSGQVGTQTVSKFNSYFKRLHEKMWAFFVGQSSDKINTTAYRFMLFAFI